MKTESLPHVIEDKPDLWKEIAAHPFLAGMSADHLELLARHAAKKTFAPDEIIFRAGAPAHGFYLVETGRIALQGWVMEHGPVATDIVRSGEPLGWSWLFPPYRWHFDARAIEPTTAIYFDGDILRQHYNEDLTLAHDLSKRICEVMVHRLQATRRKLIETAHKSRLSAEV
jgi:CRP/FNR family transcriptional regulator, cyclic AMP receptor protein